MMLRRSVSKRRVLVLGTEETYYAITELFDGFERKLESEYEDILRDRRYDGLYGELEDEVLHQDATARDVTRILDRMEDYLMEQLEGLIDYYNSEYKTIEARWLEKVADEVEDAMDNARDLVEEAGKWS